MERPIAYACKNNEREQRLSSSSGGLFYALAEHIISQGGTVFGARFNENWEVVHSCCDNLSELKQFVGSKYVQSCLGDVFLQVKKRLDSNLQVMFVGTPCQVSGLKAYLGREYDHLLLVDFICHGVPSPLVWKNYLSENFELSRIRRINFREKSDGWSNFSLRVDSENGTYRKTLREDWYLKGFLRNIYLRPSCYECAFKGDSRASDLTLADFWGVRDILPDFFDEDGVSLLLVNDDKGEEIWEAVKERFAYQEVSVENAFKRNSAALKPCPRPAGRDKYFAETGSVKDRVKKITGDYFTAKVIRKLKRVLQLERNVM